MLYTLPASFLCYLLGDTFPVDTSVYGSPCDFARVLSLQEKRLLLARAEAKDLAVHADVQLTFACRYIPYQPLKSLR